MSRTFLVVSLATALVAGCAGVSGTVSDASGTRSGSRMPDFHYISAQGWRTSFDWARQPLALVAFTEGGALDPTMADLADRLYDLPVTVAQISLADAPPARKAGMISLVDVRRIAWEAYGRPTPGELLLLNERGDVVLTGSLADPHAVVQKARRLGETIKQQQDRLEQRAS